MRHRPTRSIITRRIGSDFLRWLTAFRMHYMYHKSTRQANKNRIYLTRFVSRDPEVDPQCKAANNSPPIPPASTTHAGLTFHRNSTPSDITAIVHRVQLRNASAPSRNVTPPIRATAHTFTESRNAAIHAD